MGNQFSRTEGRLSMAGAFASARTGESDSCEQFLAIPLARSAQAGSDPNRMMGDAVECDQVLSFEGMRPSGPPPGCLDCGLPGWAGEKVLSRPRFESLR